MNSIYQWYVLIFLFIVIPLPAQENYTLLNRAAELFQKEKIQIKNFKVNQEVSSKIKETSGTVIENRLQSGFFKSPEEYIFIVKEIEINGMKQFLAKPMIERIFKSEVDWLSKEGISSHSFQTISSDSGIVKYLVNPQKIQPGYYRGQLWLNPKNAKILKILKEPIIKKREMMKYSLELVFDTNYTYQEPSHTLLSAIYQIENRITEVKVEAKFQDYKFNIDPSELPK